MAETQKDVAQHGRQRQRVGLGPAGGEHDIAGRDPNQRRHLFARGLHQMARGPAGGVHRRGVAGHRQALPSWRPAPRGRSRPVAFQSR